MIEEKDRKSGTHTTLYTPLTLHLKVEFLHINLFQRISEPYAGKDLLNEPFADALKKKCMRGLNAKDHFTRVKIVAFNVH